MKMILINYLMILFILYLHEQVGTAEMKFTDLKDIKMHMFNPFYIYPKTHSWFLAIEQRNSHRAKCGASLIRENEYLKGSKIALTAAQCVCNQTARNPMKNLKVVAGKRHYDRKDPWEEHRDIAEIICHPEFRRTSTGRTINDVAVVRLSEPLKFKENVIEPIELADANLKKLLPDCVLAGWGYAECEKRVLPNVLQQMWGNMLSRSACEKLYPKYDHETMLCFNDVDHHGATPQLGDSGGPLVCWSDGAPIQVGVIIADDPTCSPVEGGVAVSVGHFHEWVIETMQQLLGMR